VEELEEQIPVVAAAAHCIAAEVLTFRDQAARELL
jgi:hypothetical protein